MALNETQLKLDMKQLANDIADAVIGDQTVDTKELSATGLASAIANYISPLVTAYNNHIHPTTATVGSSTVPGVIGATTIQV